MTEWMGMVLGLEIHPDLWASVLYLEIFIEGKMPAPDAVLACREMSAPFFRSAAQLPTIEFYDERIAAVEAVIKNAHAVPLQLRGDGLVLVADVQEELDNWRRSIA